VYGLNELTGADQTVEIEGRTYRLGPLTLKDYGEIENRIIARRPDPVALVLQSLHGLNPRQQEFLLGRAYDRAAAARQATIAELDLWKRTPEGVCYLFWLMVRKGHPEITFERAAELVEHLATAVREELPRRADDVGLPRGNRSGQAQPLAAT
jgi:hypothetical protein